MQVIDAREPRRVLYHLSSADYDGSIEYSSRTSRPSLSQEYAPDRPPDRIANATIGVLSPREIITFNDDGGEQGFLFQQLTHDNQQIQGAYIGLPAAERPGFLGGVGAEYRVALLARRRTDSLIVDLHTLPAGVRLRPDTSVGRAAWYSFAFMLRVAATELLDVDPQELEAGFRTWPREIPGPDGGVLRVPAGQAFLCDRWKTGRATARFSPVRRSSPGRWRKPIRTKRIQSRPTGSAHATSATPRVTCASATTPTPPTTVSSTGVSPSTWQPSPASVARPTSIPRLVASRIRGDASSIPQCRGIGPRCDGRPRLRASGRRRGVASLLSSPRAACPPPASGRASSPLGR